MYEIPQVSTLQSLLRQGYKPYVKQSDMLRSFLRLAMAATRSARGCICLTDGASSVDEHSNATLIVDSETGDAPDSASGDEPPIDQSPQRDARLSCEEYCQQLIQSSRSSLVTPLMYQRRMIGKLVLVSNSEDAYSAIQSELANLIAYEITYQLKRHEISSLIRARHSKDLVCIGVSKTLRRIDRFIENVSQTDLPALIVGEFGSEKEYVAYGIHFVSQRRNGPLVKVNCPALNPFSLKSELLALFAEADRGTIYLEGVDELEYRSQCQLLDLLQSGITAAKGEDEQRPPVNVKVVASASRNLNQMVQDRQFYRPLLEELGYFTIMIAPLRKRREDIKHLIEYFLEKYNARPEQGISSEVRKICESYSWPGNIYEMSRVMACLATSSDKETIDIESLKDYAPKLLEGWTKRKRKKSAVPKPCSCTVAKEERLEIKEDVSPAAALANNLMRGDFNELRLFHPGTRRALEYIAQNYQEEFSLNQLARQARLSASHLSYLLQRSIGMSFKAFLAVIRIEKAKQLLGDNPFLSITEVSGAVGFDDLRHFERVFKRLIGKTPTEYRAEVKLSQIEPGMAAAAHTQRK